jgi:hypothetical protein
MDSRLRNKNKQLTRIINLLLNKYGDRIIIKDFWDSDSCAIGLCDRIEKHLIYISNYGLPTDRYDIVLENLSENKEIHTIIGEYKNIPFEKLEWILLNHLVNN